MSIHWPTIFDEALSLFVEHLRIAPPNPPGKEVPATRWFGAILGSHNQA